MRIQEIIIIDKESKEVIAQIPFNEDPRPLILKKGLELKVSYKDSFKTKNVNGKLVLAEQVKRKMSDLKKIQEKNKK